MQFGSFALSTAGALVTTCACSTSAELTVATVAFAGKLQPVMTTPVTSAWVVPRLRATRVRTWGAGLTTTLNEPASVPAQSPGLITTTSYVPAATPLGTVPVTLVLDTNATPVSGVRVAPLFR